MITICERDTVHRRRTANIQYFIIIIIIILTTSPEIEITIVHAKYFIFPRIIPAPNARLRNSSLNREQGMHAAKSPDLIYSILTCPVFTS